MNIKIKLVAQKIFDNDLVVIHKIKTILTLSKSAYVRMCILELNKVPMYEFHYDYVKNKYGNKLTSLLRDSDRLVYDIGTNNVYDDFRNNKEMFDFSNYFVKSKYYNDSKVLVFSKMKAKMDSIAIEEFVGLKPKM